MLRANFPQTAGSNNMTKKKKNNVSIQAKKAGDKQLDARFLERIKFIAKAMIGEEKFDLIPSYFFEAVTTLRVPVLKARKATPESDILKSTVVQYNKLFTAFINEHTIETDYKIEIPLGWYFNEGIVLLNYISMMPDNHFSEAAMLKEAFKEYLPGSEHHTWLGNVLEVTIFDANVFLSEPDKFVIHADMTDTAYINPETTSNAISIQRVRTEKTKVLVDDHYRTTLKVGWVLADEKWEYPSIKPAQIGFEGEGADVPVHIYIQQHAINKLQERIDITPGILYFGLGGSFMDEHISYVKKDNYSLVAYFLSEQKVGYLLCKWCDNKILITTFLFLTNDGTPEGKKLRELLLLEKADKAYLGIDTMPHFNSYHFEKDEWLSNLFIEAGCGSLLKIGHLEEFSKKSIADKDPESIHKYISDFALFKKGK